MKDELDNFYARFEALEPSMLATNLYAVESIRFLKRILKHKTGLSFSDEDILKSVHQIVTTKIESVCPKAPLMLFKKTKKIGKDVVTSEEVVQQSILTK